MILYRKGSSVRVRRSAVPVPPYWCATSIALYGAKRATPIAIDFLDLRVTHAERLETTIVDEPVAELERLELRQPLQAPLLIDAAESAEIVFRRGADTLAYAGEHQLPSLLLTSARGALPAALPPRSIIAIAAWPLDLLRLEAICAEAGARATVWGLAVPLLYPITTDLAALSELVSLAARHGATFVGSLILEVEQNAKAAIARSLMTDDEDDEQYETLFHADLDAIHVASERHLAALTHQAGMQDFILPPDWEMKTNWNAAILLMIAATRMLAMEHEVELAGTLARSARLVATLDKPLARVAEAASLSIIDALDDVSVDILTEWLESGKSNFIERLNERWRVRRDYVV